MITSQEAKNRIIIAFEEHIVLLQHHKLSDDLIKKWEKELVDYISQQEKITELLGLYQKFHGLFSLNSEVESYDDNWGMPADCEILLSNNPLSETNIVDEKMIDLFHQIEQLEKELGEMK